MTRGRIYLFDSKGICYRSDQYLSDMYLELPNGHGNDIIAAFLRRKLRNKSDLMKYTKNAYVKWFNHEIDDEDELVSSYGWEEKISINEIADDYSYILNCSGKSSTLWVDGNDFMIDKDEMIVMNFEKVVMKIRRGRGKKSVSLIDDEISICVSALDFYNRMYIGQYDEIDWSIRMRLISSENYREREYTRRKLYEAVRSIIMKDTSIGEYNLDASLGIWNEQTDNRAKSSYDIQQIMRYIEAYCRSPEGGTTINFYEPLIKGSLSEIGCECRQENEHVIETIIINSEHAEIMDDALYIYTLLHSHNVKGIFEYFTDDPIALEIVEIIDKMYKGLEQENDYINKINKVRKKIIFAGAITYGK
ncbi:MAG: hypothetical protein IKP88_05965 [Lachnospiraceae bacterium]|nr:hypothetical protein [Lachnospiraceae bacterium]